MENASILHRDVLKLAHTCISLQLFQHSLEEKTKCQRTTREENYKLCNMIDRSNELKDLILEHLASSKQENLKVKEAMKAVPDLELSRVNYMEQHNCSQIITETSTTDLSRAESSWQRIDESTECRSRSLQCCRGFEDASFQSTNNNKKTAICRNEDSDVEVDRFEYEGMSSEEADGEALKVAVETRETGEPTMALDRDTVEASGTVIYKTEPEFKLAFPRNSVICGLAILNSELYVASETEIEVFDARADTPISIRKFAVKGLVQARDLKASVKNNCLYTMDLSNGQRNEIFVTDRNGTVLNKWAVENYGNLSITEEGTIVLAVQASAKVVEYSHEGHLIQEVCLSEYKVQNLWHAIKLRSGNFVVSCNHKENHFTEASGEVSGESGQPGIYVVDSTGAILKEFIGLELSQPMYLDIDRNGAILVADWGRVSLLNSDLQFQRHIVTDGNGVEAPTAICLCQSTGELFVADNYSHNFRRCLAFRVSEIN